ncbi:uncharacterized protein LACBIDRAFT_334101 [Laccaria bicolor S238N-H82]|uniref:Predicted protein n=1 Tax=Laccaria bicolor (strain S238N-H82 / ATCC MYA-4686) TaxID=486041 RepID=B0DY33_LACBS|nr:uncharacterized protein LACBIDRAFT_334101 [Laccaria bicolor S238N-H82]EDR00448.1 predicted protein [Laccaria bicolor S238N-H82]|eukprot:XP_001888840.1 predicted protein [Laccaria bicolor S238N-H82]
MRHTLYLVLKQALFPHQHSSLSDRLAQASDCFTSAPCLATHAVKSKEKYEGKASEAEISEIWEKPWQEIISCEDGMRNKADKATRSALEKDKKGMGSNIGSLVPGPKNKHSTHCTWSLSKVRFLINTPHSLVASLRPVTVLNPSRTRVLWQVVFFLPFLFFSDLAVSVTPFNLARLDLRRTLCRSSPFSVTFAQRPSLGTDSQGLGFARFHSICSDTLFLSGSMWFGRIVHHQFALARLDLVSPSFSLGVREELSRYFKRKANTMTLYAKEGPPKSNNLIFSSDLFISRSISELSKSVRPPHTAASLKGHTCKIEGVENSALYLPLSGKKPSDDSNRLALRGNSGLALGHDHLRLCCNLGSNELPAWKTEQRYAVSKTSFDEADSSLGHIDTFYHSATA